MPLTLHIFEERYKQMIAHCLATDQMFGVLLIREGREVGGPAMPFLTGTTAEIIGVEKLLEGRMNLVAVGRKRFRLLEVVQKMPYLVGQVEYVPHLLGERAGVISATDTVRKQFAEYLQLMAAIVEAEVNVTELPAEPASLAYAVATGLQVENDVKQQLLEAESVEQVLEAEALLLPKEIVRLRMLAELEQERKKLDEGTIGSFSRN